MVNFSDLKSFLKFVKSFFLWTNQTIQFKDPTTSLLISIFAGHLGIDRFYIGDVGMGVGKLLTCGGLGIWTIVDWFLIMDATRDKNAELLASALSY